MKHYYVKFVRPNGEFGIKEFKEQDNVAEIIAKYIKEKTEKGCSLFGVKESSIPMLDTYGERSILPILNVTTEERYDKLHGEDITSKFIK